MKVKKVIEQIEQIFGRQSEGYMIQLINDALIDIGSTKQNLIEEKKIDLIASSAIILDLSERLLESITTIDNARF